MSASPSDRDDTPRDEDPSHQFEHTSSLNPEQSQTNTPNLEQEINKDAYVLGWIQDYNPKAKDETLWEWFQTDFAGWGVKEWDMVGNKTRQTLKLLLRENGVLVTRGRKNEGLPH